MFTNSTELYFKHIAEVKREFKSAKMWARFGRGSKNSYQYHRLKGRHIARAKHNLLLARMERETNHYTTI